MKYTPVKKYPRPRPTIFEKAKFSRENSVSLLYSAVKGMGTNEKLLIEVIANLNSEQRQELRKGYMMRYRKDIVDVMRDELSGDFEDICVALVTDDLCFDVHTITLLIEQESRHLALIGLMARTSSNGLKLIKKQYKMDFEHDLFKKIDREMEKGFADVMKALLSGNREGGKKIDHKTAQSDTDKLIEFYKDRNADKFTQELLNGISYRNANHVREVCEAFRQTEGKELTEAVEELMGKKEAVPYNGVVEACDDSACFFAGCLQHCFDGIGTDDVTLIRIFVARSEIDLADIADAYEEMYDKSLEKSIISETSGDYKTILLKLLHGNAAQKQQQQQKDKEEEKEAKSPRGRSRSRSRARQRSPSGSPRRGRSPSRDGGRRRSPSRSRGRSGSSRSRSRSRGRSPPSRSVSRNRNSDHRKKTSSRSDRSDHRRSNWAR